MRVSWSSFFTLLEVFSGLIGLIGLVYGGYVLLVERSKIISCSLEMFSNQNDLLVAQQPKITVEVNGAVNQSGVWLFDRGERVGEAIERSAGVSSDADKEFVAKRLNLAKTLVDGDKIYIPFEWERESEKEVGQKTTDQNLISINTSSQEELETLSGIGESRAQSIIENRPFEQLRQLIDKKIISESMFNDLEGLLSL